MASIRGTVSLKCPQCHRSYSRLYKEFENGFGFCVDPRCNNTRVVRASRLQDEKKLGKIKAELSGKMVHSSSSGRTIT